MIDVFQKEIDDGLSEIVRANASIAYTSPIILKDVKVVPPSPDLPGFMVASIDDLFPMNSILATTGWNLNDDVFDPVEMWMAKSSPVNKPFNMDHVQRDIIGHITACLPVDEGLSPIPLDTVPENLPDVYHLLTSSVIYKLYPDDPDFEASIARTINEIQDNQWFVSMECLFQGFDYAMRSSAGLHKVIERNPDTSFLTKYLRAYRGTGAYQDHRIGRLMKNITFSGKGLVRNPGNPNSIIFAKTNKFKSVAKDMVYLSNESKTSNNLPEKPTMDLQEQVDKLEKALAKVNGEKEVLAGQLADANVNSFKTKASELETSVKAKDEALVAAKKEIETLTASLKEVTDKLTAADKDAKDLADKFEKMKKDKSKSDRISKLVAASFPVDKAEMLAAGFENSTDEEFEGIVALAEMALKAGSVNVDTPNSKPPIAVTPVKTPAQYVKDAINSTPKSTAMQINTVQGTSAFNWVDEVAKINTQINEVPTETSSASAEVSPVEATRAKAAAYLSDCRKSNKKTK
jgi:hypothetical protein